MADLVVPHLASQVRDGVDVVFLDTGYHFAETIGTRDAAAATLQVNVRTHRRRSRPSPSRTRSSARGSTSATPTSAARCARSRRCAATLDELRRLGVRPAPRRGPARANTRVVEWDDRRSMVKLNPIAAWTQDDVDPYIAENGVLVNPLLVRRLRLDRLRAVHPPDQAGRGPARRPLGRHVEDGVRHPLTGVDRR